MSLNTGPLVDQYQKAFAEHGRSQSAVLCPKGRQRIRYAAMLKDFDLKGRTLLDYGCGLAHLHEYLVDISAQCQYRGVDIVPEFVADNAARFMDARFDLIAGVDDVVEPVDIVVASGVFNIQYVEDREANRQLVFAQLSRLFEVCKVGMCVDFLSDMVDFQVPGAFHISPMEVFDFARRNLGRRVVVDHSYLPYEYCVAVFKEEVISRGQGIYEHSTGRNQNV